MPMRRRTSTGSTLGAVQVLTVIRDPPRDLGAAMRSFMRLNDRSSVLLPQPDGPMSAVMR